MSIDERTGPVERPAYEPPALNWLGPLDEFTESGITAADDGFTMPATSA